jgi:signal transduction histidine kinase
MGLGLTYSRRAVEAMGGSIDFESDVGKGTKFTINMAI